MFASRVPKQFTQLADDPTGGNGRSKLTRVASLFKRRSSYSRLRMSISNTSGAGKALVLCCVNRDSSGTTSTWIATSGSCAASGVVACPHVVALRLGKDTCRGHWQLEMSWEWTSKRAVHPTMSVGLC